jgi:predicted ATPase/DNA-binding XRE family transcriptional regulator
MPHDPTLGFGDLLRQYRQAAGLTQEGLAERAGLSVHGIQKLERGVTHPYRDTAHRLATALQLSPENEEQFRAAVQPVRRHGMTRRDAPPAQVHDNLPMLLSSFIGRDRELVDVVARLESARLLTLTGVGGCGKTRLAIEVARAIQAKYPDGVWLVELGPLSDPALVAQQVGAVLEVRESREQPLTTALIRALAGRRVLLVLDNCEHLLQACALLLNSLLRGCPELHVLATSREPIGIDGEVAWRVPSLAVPGSDEPASLGEHNPSVQLFVERASSAQSRFTFSARNAQAVAQICQRLDGIPLALELAAARIQALTAEQLALRLDQRFRLLTGGSRAALPRQQTLQATLDWSYELLSKSERRLFERLAVFAGGWTLEAAEAVGVGVDVSADDVLDLLEGLVRKSLILANEAADGTERFAFLETVRDYARQKLLARGRSETRGARERHAAFYSSLAERIYSGNVVRGMFAAAGTSAGELRGRIEEVHDNLRTALDWWLDTRDPARGLLLTVALSEFWMMSGLYVEGRRWVEQMLDLANEMTPAAGAAEGSVASASVELRADALIIVGIFASWQGDHVRSCAFLEAGEALARETDNTATRAAALAGLGLSLWLAGDQERSATVLNESLRLSLEVGNPTLVANAQRQLGIVARWEAQYEQAAALLHKSVAQATANRGFSLARSLSNLGRVAYFQQDHQQASTLLGQAFEVVREARLGGWPLADSLDWLAAIAVAQGDTIRAARLFGAAEAQWRASGAVRYAPDQPVYERDVTNGRTKLDKDTFEAAWAEGRLMSAQEAIAYALEETRQELRPSATSAVGSASEGLEGTRLTRAKPC